MTSKNRADYNSYDLSNALADQFQYSRQEAKMVVEFIFDELGDMMADGKDVFIYNFGLFLPKRVYTRRGKRTVARLMAAKSLNEKLDEGYEAMYETDDIEEQVDLKQSQTELETEENLSDSERLTREIMNEISFELVPDEAGIE